jgi:LacI family transcriptional regulator, galactose operon repressor
VSGESAAGGAISRLHEEGVVTEEAPSARRDTGAPVARVTLTDVARRAGVSIATVSYVVNGREGVGEKTRAHVLAIAEEIGFRPNRLASGLRTGQTRVLGLVLADITNPFYPEIAGGVIAAAAQAGYEVFLSHSRIGDELEGEEVRALCDHQCAALIFTSLTVGDGPLIAQVVPREVPIVQTVRRVPGLAADFVGIDDRAGAREAATHLVELGHTDVALLTGPLASSASQDRASGFREVLAEAGVEPDDDRVVECRLTVDAGYAGATQLLEARREAPGAMLCGNDLIALGAIDALADHGLSVPGDVSIVGYDDIWFSSSRLVQLTTVRQPRQAMGQAAVSLALDRLADGGIEPREVILPHELVVRRTAAPPRGGRRR